MNNKALKIGFIVFSVFAVIFGVIRIKQIIQISEISPSGQDQESSAQEESLADYASRYLDTDEDGLSDWEEVNVHGTSMYLADTDSDGISDKEEIAQGTDPNCEHGKICGSDIIGVIEQVQKEQEESGQGEAEGSALITDFSQKSLEALEALNQGTMPSPDQIRSLLIDSGISREDVDIASDEELLELFQEVSQQPQAQ